MPNTSKIKLLLLTGGSSREHEISVKSRNFVLQFIDENKYEIINVLIKKDKTWIFEGTNQECHLIHKSGNCVLLVENHVVEFDIIFPLVLGDGEDGSLQGLFESLKAPYIGTKVLGSAICFDKISSKYIMQAHATARELNIKCVPFIEYSDKINFQKACTQLSCTKVFIKPSNSGSTLGANAASNEEQFQKAILDAQKYDNAILIEKYLENVRELFCGIIYSTDKQPIVSAIGEAFYEAEYFTYELKYGKDNILVPAEIDQEIAKQIKEQSVAIFNILRCCTFARIDFFLYQNQLYFSEVNTIPAMTPTSIFLKLMLAAGYNRELTLEMLFQSTLNKGNK